MATDTLTQSDQITDSLRAAVDHNFDDQVAFLARMVQFRGLRGQEAPQQDWMAERFAERLQGRLIQAWRMST